MPAQFITDPKGNKKGVILSLKEYEQLMDDHEELAAIKAYDKAVSGPLKFSPAFEAFKRIEGQ